MRENDRNPWHRLTSSQIAQLDAAAQQPAFLDLEPSEVYATVSNEFANRCAVALVHNDLRAAIDAAEISWAARRIADKRAVIAAESAERAERLRAEADPKGRWVEIPGTRKKVRVRPGENVQQRVDERRAELEAEAAGTLQE